MNIRQAVKKDAQNIFELLQAVQALHANGRPDIFKHGASKYRICDVENIIENVTSPVYVLTDQNDIAVGYAFCIVQIEKETENLYAKKTLYIDDLCVKDSLRGQGLGTKLYEYVLEKASQLDCDRLTLNVWHLNESALRFYKKLGLKPLKTTMEQKIK